MIPRNLENELNKTINQRKSFFLFGPRQTGKTTLLNHLAKQYKKVINYSFLNIRLRQRAEQKPEIIRQEVEASSPEIVIIDEVQKVPEILDEVQYMIDRYELVFLITGSSARKLRRKNVNLLAGRAITYRLDPFDIEERKSFSKDFRLVNSLKNILIYGDMPEIALLAEDRNFQLVENLLRSYSETFLEEEIRMETLVRNIGIFGNFLRLAAENSGRILSFRALSLDVGVTHHTISTFYEILYDCMIVERIHPLIPSGSRRRLSKACKYLFFDLGIRNAAAQLLTREGITREEWGHRFEEWIGLSLIRYLRSRNLPGNIYYWRDHNGPEIDWIVEQKNQWIPVEVKFIENPQLKHINHLELFINENQEKTSKGYLIFLGDKPRKITDRITALPWFELYRIFE
ncbi:MAG: ATP-binding protein [Candidatus Aminicenantes bacterium]|nr:ATP-binding protein [Candidatus Aminicenantes bacterium]